MELKTYLNEWISSETEEVGLYLAMARKAQREGYPEVAEVLKRIAYEEADHAAIACEMAEKIDSTKQNLQKMLEGERKAAQMRLEEAEHHQLPDSHWLYVTAQDESRHAEELSGLLNRYF